MLQFKFKRIYTKYNLFNLDLCVEVHLWNQFHFCLYDNGDNVILSVSMQYYIKPVIETKTPLNKREYWKVFKNMFTVTRNVPALTNQWNNIYIHVYRINKKQIWTADQ